jgi:hypothetical protein
VSKIKTKNINSFDKMAGFFIIYPFRDQLVRFFSMTLETLAVKEDFTEPIKGVHALKSYLSIESDQLVFSL